MFVVRLRWRHGVRAVAVPVTGGWELHRHTVAVGDGVGRAVRAGVQTEPIAGSEPPGGRDHAAVGAVPGEREEPLDLDTAAGQPDLGQHGPGRTMIMQARGQPDEARDLTGRRAVHELGHRVAEGSRGTPNED